MVDFSKFWWLTPIHGAVPDASAADVRAFAKYRLGMSVVALEGYAEVNAVRSMLANYALNKGAEVTLFVDADTTPTPKTALHLVQEAAKDRGMHSALYMRPSRKTTAQEGPLAFCLGNDEPFIMTTGKAEGGPIIMPKVGFGCVAIHRGVYAKIAPLVPRVEWGDDPAYDGPHYFMPEMVGTRYLHDDFVFCKRAAEVGIDPVLWSDLFAVHWKTQGLVPPEGEFVVDEDGKVKEADYASTDDGEPDDRHGAPGPGRADDPADGPGQRAPETLGPDQSLGATRSRPSKRRQARRAG